jgi:hypothetical protein
MIRTFVFTCVATFFYFTYAVAEDSVGISRNRGLDLGAEVLRTSVSLIISPGVEVWIRYRATPYVELWAESGALLLHVRQFAGDQQEVRTSGQYIKAGVNLPIGILKSQTLHFSFGARFGMARGNEHTRLDIRQTYWNTTEVIEQSRNFSAQWMEYMFSAEKFFVRPMQSLAPVSIVVSLRLKYLLGTQATPAPAPIIRIPGYGRGDNGVVPAFKVGVVLRLTSR